MSSVGGSYRDERFEGVVRVSMCSSSERRFEDPNSFEITNARGFPTPGLTFRALSVSRRGAVDER
jgi:hypothetical protein